MVPGWLFLRVFQPLDFLGSTSDFGATSEATGDTAFEALWLNQVKVKIAWHSHGFLGDLPNFWLAAKYTILYINMICIPIVEKVYQ